MIVSSEIEENIATTKEIEKLLTLAENISEKLSQMHLRKNLLRKNSYGLLPQYI